jgi:hypothetical protein
MKQTFASVPIRSVSPVTLALGLSFGLALAACRLAAADTTNATVPTPHTPPSTKLVVPPEWKVDAPAHEYSFDGLPLSEVTRSLQEQTKQQFDVLIPSSVVLHMPPPGGPPAEQTDPGDFPIKFRLKNVSIVEVFQAMNMLFEIEKWPCRWELVMNGSRPVAVLRPPEIEPPPAVPAVDLSQALAQAVGHSVAYVGNLLGTPDLGKMTPDALCETLEETAKQTFPGSSTIKVQFHRGAELVVLSGTDEELRVMNEVLRALKEKVNDRHKGGAPGDQEAPARK